MTQPIYGREEPLSELKEALQWASLGSTELALISGPPGIGKTALVLEAFKPIIGEKCTFAWGKFDSIDKSRPYDPFIQCFQFLIRQLLTEPENVLQQWREKIRDAVGTNGHVIVEVIPEAALLLGDLSPGEQLPTTESQHRFEWVFRRFVRVFTRARHPLVLFFDDVQWADRATSELVRSLLVDPQIQHLYIIVAYRDRDWNENAELFHDWLQGSHHGYSVRQIHVAAFALEHVQAFVSDTLKTDADSCFPLAHTLYVKSTGNPFYLKQLLQSAFEEKMIWAEEDNGKWNWDLERLYQFPNLDGQQEYLIERIHKLPKESKRLLVWASCLGGKFSAHALGVISKHSETTLEAHLSYAIQIGFLAATMDAHGNKHYYFTHDHIHLAANSLLHRQEREQIHLAAGLYMLHHLDEAAKEQALFDMANHLNQALKLMSQEQKEAAVRLNDKAGRKAMQSAAYETAADYFNTALACLPDDYWSKHNEFTFRLHLSCSECEYLCANYERAEQLQADILRRSQGWVQRAQVVKLQIDQYSNLGKYAQAIELGLSALREAGMRIAVKPRRFVAMQEILMTKRILHGRIDELTTLEKSDDPKFQLMMELMASLVGATFFANREVLAVLSSKFIRMIYQYGTTPVAPAVYTAFGMVLSTMRKDFTDAYRLGKIAIDMVDQTSYTSIKSKVYVMFYCVISPWMGYKSEDEKQLTTAIHLGMESGDYVYASYAIGGLINMSYAVHTMQQMQKIMRQSLQWIELTNEELVYKNIKIYLHLAEMLQSFDYDDLSITVGHESEAEFLTEVMKDESKAVTLYQFYTYKTQISCLFGQYEDAVRYAELASPYEALSVQSPHLPILHFYEALALAVMLRRLSSNERSRRSRLRRLKQRLRQFQHWSSLSKAAYGYKAMLLQAEILGGSGSESEIIKLYDQAIEWARENQDVQVLALACERAALHHLGQGRERIARGYMLDAYDAYGLWGVESKRASIRDQYPDWFQILDRDQALMSETNTKHTLEHQHSRTEARDLVDLMRDTLTLSPDKNLQQVKDQLTALIMQVSGMHYGCLISHRDNVLWIEQVMRQGQKAFSQAEPLETSRAVPRSIVQYTSRLGEAVHIEHAALDELFQSDPYIVQHQCRAVSCLPIYAQEQLAGVLYLELSPQAYPLTDANEDTLCILASQTLFISKLADTFGEDAVTRIQASAPTESGKEDIDALTERELEVLNLMSTGLTNKEIAIRLGITAGTVKVHTHNIFSKLNVNRRMKAVAEAVKMNLLNP